MNTPSQQPDRRPAGERQKAIREIRRAERFAQKGQVTEAIASLEQAIRFGADRYTCYLRLARLHQARRQLSEALSAAHKAIAENPRKLSAREAVIALYLESKDYAGAVAASKDLLKLSPRHVPARDALGAAYIGLGDVEAAMRVANDLIRLDPASPSHRFTKAHLCQHKGEIRMAIQEFERVVEMAPESDLAETAREHIEALDTFQLNQILTLVMEDAVFRARVLRDADQAITDRGYYLSQLGRETLTELAEQGLADLDAPCRPTLYH
jgi:tetratricopeptide (TPR) repeat protein